MKKLLLHLLCFTSICLSQTQLKLFINEVMFYSEETNGEFIEVYNYGEEDVDLKTIKIKYHTSSPDLIVEYGRGTILKAKSYALILEKDYDFTNGAYNHFIPKDALVLITTDNSFGSSGMSNSADRNILLLSENNDTLDIYTYTTDNDQGFSDEKIYPSEINEDNWGNSKKHNGTPGFINSVSPKDYDMELSSIRYTNDAIFAKAKNIGNNPAQFSFQLFEDVNQDSTADYLVEESFLCFLEKGDSLEFKFDYKISVGQTFVIKLFFPRDQDTLNNSLSWKLQIGFDAGSVIINEIMYDPADGNCEFVEFYNTTKDTIVLDGWKFYNSSGSKLLCRKEFSIAGNSYFVLAEDSCIYSNYFWLKDEAVSITNSSLGLLNSGCEIYIKDLRGNVIDSLYYSPEWHNKNFVITKNRSLERINPFLNSNEFSNWSSSVDENGATPGKQNSILIQNSISESKITVVPNPFSPDNDGFEDFALINYNLNKTLSQVRIRIYDSQGRLVRTLVDNNPSGSNGSIIFNGLDDDGNTLRIGIYIILLEALDSATGVTDNIKSVVVVARKL